MAAALWGKVYFDDRYAGELKQEPGGRCVFTYDTSYLSSGGAAIALTLALQSEPILCERGLHPFFDNLVAEGWLRNAQARSLKIDPNNRFALLLAYGHDCAGAVSVIDPSPTQEPVIDIGDPLATAALVSRSSLSGVQAKLMAVPSGKSFRPARPNEVSTFIAKLPSGNLTDIVQNEYLTTMASKALLPDDEIVDVKISAVEGVEGEALIVKRFDRLKSGARLHFEEFNQLLGKYSGDEKYNAAYEDIASFVRNSPSCIPADAWRLYKRFLSCFLTGNTDAHLKNFAMFHTTEGLRHTPAYDLVAAALYPQFNTLTLSINGAENLGIGDLKPKHIIALGHACGLSEQAILMTIADLDKRRASVSKIVQYESKKIGNEALGQKLLDFMERRWNGRFNSIGTLLSKKQ